MCRSTDITARILGPKLAESGHELTDVERHRGPDEQGERELLRRQAGETEVDGSVDMRAAVGAHVDPRQVGDCAFGDRRDSLQPHLRTRTIFMTGDITDAGLATEWAERGIAVIAVAAGHFDTASLRKYPEPVWRAAAPVSGATRRWCSGRPTGRWRCRPSSSVVIS